MLESSFILLREIGFFRSSEQDEIHFTVDAYRGFRYVSIRRYVKTEGFSGATRDGITLTPEIVRSLEPHIQALADDFSQIVPKQIGKFAKRPGICIVVSIGEFKGKKGLDFRQWQEDVGWTKKGIWLPLDHLPEIKRLFKETREALEGIVVDDF